MTTVMFVRRFLADYARNPVNLLVLVLVPLVFVVVAAGALPTPRAYWGRRRWPRRGNHHRRVGRRVPRRRRHVLPGLRGPRRRPATGHRRPAQHPPGRRPAAHRARPRALVSAVALVALTLRTGIDAPARVAAGTLMFAAIYLAIGAVVGATVRNPVNGTVLILFIWIVDVFFGPTLSAADNVATRALPTHFVSLWMVDQPSQHGGRPGDLGWALS